MRAFAHIRTWHVTSATSDDMALLALTHKNVKLIAPDDEHNTNDLFLT